MSKGVVIISLLVILSLSAIGLFLYDRGDNPTTNIFYANENSIPLGIVSSSLVYNNITLEDSTYFDSLNNVCTAERFGMNITIYPCVIEDVDSKNIKQNVDFLWKGNVTRNVTWVFAYEGELSSESMDLLKEVQDTRTELRNTWISDYLIDRVVSYTDLGTPTNICEFGNTNNTKMYNVTRNDLNQTQYSEIYCFTTQTLINSSSFSISGNADRPQQVPYTEERWVDVSDKISFLGTGLLGGNLSYYRVQDIPFNTGQVYNTRWKYTSQLEEDSGKWHILGYESERGLTQSIMQGIYIYLDPWWDNSWISKRDINITSGNSIINLTYETDMSTEFSDIRFLDYATEGTEQSYWVQNYVSSTNAIVHLGSNLTQKLYYENAAATTASDIDSVYPGIKHYYPLDEDSGTVSTDGFGTKNLSGFKTGQWSGGRIYGGYTPAGISGVNTSFSLGEVAAADNSVSFSFWAYPTTTIGAYPTYVGSDGGNSIDSNGEFKCYSEGNDINCYTYQGALYEVKAPDFPNAQWTLFTFTYDNSNMRIYYNTTEVGIQAVAGWTPSSNAADVYLFYTETGINYLDNIIIDDIRFYNHTLTTTEISSLYSQFLNTSYTLGDALRNTGVTVTLQSPADAETLFSSVNFSTNVTPLGVNLTNVTLSVYNATAILTVEDTQTLSGNDSVNVNWSESISPDGTYTWNIYACGDDPSTTTYCSRSTNRTLTIARFGENAATYNSSVYGTSLQTFILNTTIDPTVSASSGVFRYNGTEYASTKTTVGGNTLFTSTIDIPSVTSDTIKNLYWVLTLDSVDYNTQYRNQSVNQTILALCNSSLTDSYMNFTFKDEGNETSLSAALPLSTFEYYLGSGGSTKNYTFTNSSINPSYAFCSNTGQRLSVDPRVQYEVNPAYPQRIFDDPVTNYTSTVTDIVLYLLSLNEGQYVTFQVTNIGDQPIAGVEASATRIIGSTSTKVVSGYTDAAGLVTFFLDPDFQYSFTFSKSGYTDYASTFTPTKTEYTINLGSSSTVETNVFQGLEYSILPQSERLVNDTTYSFEFNATSDLLVLTSFGFGLRLSNGTIVDYQTSATEGTPATSSYDVGNQSIIYMDYYWYGNGTYTNATRYWIIENTEYTSWSISYFFTDLTAYLDSDIFGLDDFGKNLIIYLILFISIGIMSYKYGVNNPLVVSTMIFSIIFFFDVTVNMIPTIRGVSNLPTYISGLIVVVLAFKEGTRQ